MDNKDLFELVIELIEVLTDWPIIIFLLISLFRKQIRYLLQEVVARIRLVEFGENKLEFLEIERDTFSYTLEKLISVFDTENKDTVRLKSILGLLLEKVKNQNVTGIKYPKDALVNKRILWVDDRPNNNIYESAIFETLGASIEEAYTTSEGIERINKATFDVIISDVLRVESGLENHSAGYDLLDELKNSSNKNIPLILYTGNVAWINKSRAKLAYGVVDSPEDLILKVISAVK